jgi:hypothetical protein
MSQRITSKDIRIELVPTATGVAATHIQTLVFDAGWTGGTFKLRVNGLLTAAITYLDTAATLVTNINTALDAILGAGVLVASSSVSTLVTLTGAAGGLTRFFVISFEGLALTPSGFEVSTEVLTQGGELIVISAEASSFSEDNKIDTVDVTAISEYFENKIPVKESMSWEFSLFNAQQTWLYILRSKALQGVFTVYPTGKFVNHRVGSFVGLVEAYKEDFPDHEKVEVTFSGSRIGAMIIPWESIYVG